MFSRRRARRRSGSPVEVGGLRLLMQAHSLRASGRPAEAAQIFAQLAEGAQGHGRPRRAAQLRLQAARSLADGGDGRGALAQAQAALTLLIGAGRERRALRLLVPLVADWRQRGLTAEADELQRQMEAGGDWPSTPPPPEAASPAPTGRLPAKCPSCGGPVRADEVDWIEPDPGAPAGHPSAAECPYCGSILYPEA